MMKTELIHRKKPIEYKNTSMRERQKCNDKCSKVIACHTYVSV